MRYPDFLSIRFLYLLLAISGWECRPAGDEVVVYVTVDRIYSEPVLRDFENKTGIKVRTVYDTEETKSTGIMNRIIAEASHPQCDVFWSGDPVRTQVLKQRKLLEVYRPPDIEDIDSAFIDPEGMWTGFSSRARVLIYNTQLCTVDSLPVSIFDLTKKQYFGKAAIANPLFGTTSFHIAALFAEIGSERGKEFMKQLRDNGIVVAASNGDVKKRVASGEIPFGLTDTDDAFGAMKDGEPVQMVFLDQDRLGTLVMPNTVSLIKKAPNIENGIKLINYLLSRETEEKLAATCAQMPLHSGVKTPEQVKSVREIKVMKVNYDKVARLLTEIQPFLIQWMED